VLRKDEESLKSASDFMGCETPQEFIAALENMRREIARFAGQYLRDS
jgi:hypothetical protein